MQAYTGESIGTKIPPLPGDGVVAGVLLKKSSKAENSGWIATTIGWTLAVAIAVYTVGSISGAHLNPAVTVALTLFAGFPFVVLGP